jgi:hypothetical protein
MLPMACIGWAESETANSKKLPSKRNRKSIDDISFWHRSGQPFWE